MKTKVEIRKLAIAMLSTAMFVACSENSLEPIIEPTTEEVAFDVAVKQVDTVSISLSHTRSADRGMGLPMGSFEMSDNGNTIYANQLAVGVIDAHNNVAHSKTRGTEKTSADFYSSFGLIGYFYGESETWSNTMTPMINEEITQTSGSWKASKAWPGGSKGTFFAWAPYAADNLTASSSSTPSITYSVPSTISSQQDILVCKTSELSSSKTPISLDFKHALTGVKFVVGNIGYFTEIRSIKIENVFNEGTLEIGATEWTGTSGSASYEITGPFTISSLGTENIIGGELMFLMPQTLPTGAKLTVEMANGSNVQTFTANLNDSNWPMGNTVTYKLSVEKIEGEYKFEVTPSTTSVDENGGAINYTVKSIYQYTEGTIVDVPWTATYSIDGGSESSTVGDVVTSFTASGLGGESNSYSLDIKKLYPVSDASLNQHTQSLRSATSQGSASNPQNLAGSNETTANCYIVSAPGYYKLPLVYGNGLKNGITNAESIVNREPFVNHLGNAISNPYLYNNTGVVPDHAVIVWQDAYHLVHPSSVKLSEDNKYLIFQVPQEYICQGNCVLAVRDASNTILWSWHIWVTDQNMTTVSSTNGTDTYNFMPVALGHCDADTRKTPSHSIKVNLSQNLSGKAGNLDLSQTASTHTLGVSAPYYQWGRKDPQHPGDILSKSWKQLYDNTYANVSQNGTDGFSTQATPSLGYVIQTPYVLYKFWYRYEDNDVSDYYPEDVYDLWHVGNNLYGADYRTASNEVTKSIFDPCPKGFKMSKATAYNNFEKMTATNNACEFISGNKWYIYGILAKFGTLDAIGEQAYYWSAGPNSSARSYGFYFKDNAIGKNNAYYRANAFTIRPVPE